MGEEKRVFVNSIRPDDTVTSLFLVREKSLLYGKTGQPYLSMNLCDKTGSVDAKVWDNAEQVDTLFGEGDFIKVKALATSYNGKLQLRVQNLRAVPEEEVDPLLFFESSPHDPDRMWAELTDLLGRVSNPHLRRLVRLFEEDDDFALLFKRAPAAKSIHHSYLGGLLEHTLSLARLAVMIAGHYPQVDESLLLCGILFHDMGKIRELSFDRGLSYSDEGRLVGHITLGVEMLNEKLALLTDFPPELKMVLTHLILAHHGIFEFGSPKRPKTLEAMVLSLLDDLDARVHSFTSILAGETKQGRWSNYQKIYDRYLYRWNGPDLLGEEPPSKDSSRPPLDGPASGAKEGADRAVFSNPIRLPALNDGPPSTGEKESGESKPDLLAWRKNSK